MADITYAALFGTDLKLHFTSNDNGSLFTDSACTTAATDGDAVLGWTPQLGAGVVNLTGTDGPVYRADYASTGYPALEFDGIDDRLFNTSAGLVSNVRFGVVACYTRITGTAETVWQRGTISTTQLARLLYVSDTSHYLQQGNNSGAYVTMPGVGEAGRQVVVCLFEAARFGLSMNRHAAMLPATLVNDSGASFYVGAGDQAGSVYQPANVALHEILCVQGSVWETGSLHLAATKMRYDWGVTDESPVHQAGGGVRIPNIRGGADQ